MSADAFAVALGKGLTMPRLSRRGGVLIAVMFGTFQGVMPLIGWLLGTSLEGYIESIDHWIAFGLLTSVGARMLREAFPSDAARWRLPAEVCGGLILIFIGRKILLEHLQML